MLTYSHKLPINSLLLGLSFILAACNQPSTSTYAPGSSELPVAATILFDSVSEFSKTVVPGLAISIRGTYLTEREKINSNPQRVMFIRQHGRVIYTDTVAEFLYIGPFETKPYPIWLPTGRDSGELLVYLESPLDVGRRFLIEADHVARVDTLPVFSEQARNLDKDPNLEFSGYHWPGPAEKWDSAGCSWTTYRPKLYYEIRPAGLVLDSALTQQQATAQYGAFHGFTYFDKPLIRLAAPLK